MSDFLKLNGITIAIALGSARVGPPEEIGQMTRSFGGTLRRSRQAVKEVLSVGTIPLTAAEARAWRKLLLGEGHHWSFDSTLYSSKGLVPIAGYTASQAVSAGSKYGGGYLEVNASGGNIAWPTALGSAWTVMVWRLESGTWHHYVVRSDGAKWVDGVRDDLASTTWLTAGGAQGDVSISNPGALVQEYDDLVVLPFSVPDAWAAAVYAAGEAFSDLPKLSAAGELVDGTLTVMADLEDSPVLRGATGGAVHKNLQRVSFRLREV